MATRSFADLLPVKENEDLYRSTPPPFGRDILRYFGFDPKYVNLNHGSYGSLPHPVRRAAEELSSLIESNPDLFMKETYFDLLIHTRTRLAKFIGAGETDEVVLVPNASHGISTILRNFEWNEGDILIEATPTYNSISRTLHFLSDIPPHPTVNTFPLEFPTTHAKIISSWRDHIKSIPRTTSPDANKPQKIVAVIDSIASNPGVLLPWREMVQICKEEGIWTIIDAAHSIGQELDVEVEKSGCDFWVSNCHKWLTCKRICAVMYVPKRNQHIIKSSFPTSYTYLSPSDPKFPDFVNQFLWTGTIDWVPYLTVGAALDFRTWLGGEEKINEWCHKLAVEGGEKIAEVLGTEVMKGKDDHELCLNMVNVRLPLSSSSAFPYTAAVERTLRKYIWSKGTYVAHYPHAGKVWIRASAQIWNELEDFEYVGNVLKGLCEGIESGEIKVV